jgi:hypothetical protein
MVSAAMAGGGNSEVMPISAAKKSDAMERVRALPYLDDCILSPISIVVVTITLLCEKKDWIDAAHQCDLLTSQALSEEYMLIGIFVQLRIDGGRSAFINIVKNLQFEVDTL